MSIKTAADALAAAAKANIEACYALTESTWRLNHCEQAPWTEEALRRDAARAVDQANALTTHVDLVTALANYETAVRMEELTEAVRESTKTVEEMGTKMMDVFGMIEQKLGIAPKPPGAPFDEPLPAAPTDE